ncbi:MAG: hypothetical protein NC299_14885 [Lachnospiraceae bacterium]|nr:hypothetical protein [Ruminococcus sp.]MCM1276622.1 hypothetical protein [Lachnospiraceae bacterium]
MRCLLVSFKKISSSSGFYFCIIMTVVLLFSAEVYTDYSTQSRYSVIRLIMDFDREYYLNNEMLCADRVMQNACGGWLGMFLPIITSFCFVPRICVEKSANAIRFEVFRTSKLKFDLSKFISGVLSSGIAVTLGYMVFCAVIGGIFPGAREYAIEIIPFDFPAAMLGMFLYGVFWSVPSMFLTSVLGNKYLIMCIPFFAKYGLSQLCNKLLSDFALDFESPNLKIAEFLTIANPQALLFSAGDTNYWKTVLFYGAVFAAFLTAYLLINRGRSDYGA